MKNNLMIYAHPDDEIIFGWPFLQLMEEKSEYCDLVIVCSDIPSYSNRRIKSLISSCGIFSCFNTIEILNLNSNFYKNSPREKGFELIYNFINKKIVNYDYKNIFTHNPWGEYGHFDHIRIFNIVWELCCCNLQHEKIKFTNESIQNTPWTYKESIENKIRLYNVNEIENVKMSKKTQEKIKKSKNIYLKHKAWTWSKEISKTVKLSGIGYEKQRTL